MKIIQLVPCYNEEHRLDSFLESVKSQTVPVEIIAVDDGSKDNTFEKLQSSNLLHVERNATNLGTTKTVNRLFSIAKRYKPDFITWSGADDNLYSDSIAERLDHQKRLECDILVTGADTQTLERKLLYPELPPQHVGLRKIDFSDLYRELLSRNFLQVPVLVNTRNVSFDHLLYNESLKHFSDWDQHLRLARIYSYGFLDKATACSDWDGTNFSSPNVANYHEKFRELVIILRNHTQLSHPGTGALLRCAAFTKSLSKSIYYLIFINWMRLIGRTSYQ
jgi:glycosyltransferase involved in cell wall biosynthesis